MMLFAYLKGFALSFSLILAIGSQNAFVLRQGLLRQHVFAVVLFCAVADMALIVVGVGGLSLLAMYVAILMICLIAALRSIDRFSSLLIQGISVTFFLFFAVNMSMVMGMAPVVGVPLPLVSYGGSAMLVLLVGFGLIQSAHVHRPREKL